MDLKDALVRLGSALAIKHDFDTHIDCVRSIKPLHNFIEWLNSCQEAQDELKELGFEWSLSKEQRALLARMKSQAVSPCNYCQNVAKFKGFVGDVTILVCDIHKNHVDRSIPLPPQFLVREKLTMEKYTWSNG